MVRPRVNTDNNWNDCWYQQLRKQACYVVQALNANDVDLDELINVAWYSDVRYVDSETEVLKYTRRIRKRMFYYLRTKYPSLIVVRRPLSEYVNYDDIEKVLDNTELVKMCFELLTDDEITLLRAYYESGLMYSEIGEKLGITKQGIHRRLNRIKNKIRANMKGVYVNA